MTAEHIDDLSIEEQQRNGPVASEVTDGFTETGEQYFERQWSQSDPYEVLSQDATSINIRARPGLKAKIIAAGLAKKRQMTVHCEVDGGTLVTVTPAEAHNLLRQKMGDIFGW